MVAQGLEVSMTMLGVVVRGGFHDGKVSRWAYDVTFCGSVMVAAVGPIVFVVPMVLWAGQFEQWASRLELIDGSTYIVCSITEVRVTTGFCNALEWLFDSEERVIVLCRGFQFLGVQQSQVPRKTIRCKP